MIQDGSVKRAPFQIPSLDGLRAVSFFIVFLAHAGVSGFPGGFGVTVFFFLSGYLITTLMRKEDQKTGQINLKNFYLRRVLRILPPFYTVLVLTTSLALAGFLKSELEARAILAQALHYSNFWIARHGWSGVASGTGVYWSLAVEEHFYLVFPALYLLLRRMNMSHRAMAFVLWTICGAVLAWRCALVIGFHAEMDRTYLATDARFDSMLFGCALALHGNPVLDSTGQASGTLFRYVLLPLGVTALFFTFVYRGAVFRETFRYTIQGLALYPIFISAIRWPDWFVFRVLNLRPVRFVGVLSYSLYLVHHAILFMVEQHTSLPKAVRGLLALGLAIAVAWGMWRLIEEPCAKLRRRLSTAD